MRVAAIRSRVGASIDMMRPRMPVRQSLSTRPRIEGAFQSNPRRLSVPSTNDAALKKRRAIRLPRKRPARRHHDPPQPRRPRPVRLLCSRVCHDVISPVGAIVNGLEGPGGRERRFHAGVRPGADRQERPPSLGPPAVRPHRLRGGRLGRRLIDLADAEKVSRGMFADDKTQLAWSAPRRSTRRTRSSSSSTSWSSPERDPPRGPHRRGGAGGRRGPTLTLKSKGSHARIRRTWKR